MGFILRDSTDVVTVSYNRTDVTELDEEILKYAIASFSHLLQRARGLCFAQFSNVIRRHYAVDGKIKLCLEVLEKAAIKNRYLCSFKYDSGVDGVVEVRDARIEVEHWSQVREVLEEAVNTQVTDLALQVVSCVYRKGSLTYNAQRKEVQL